MDFREESRNLHKKEKNIKSSKRKFQANVIINANGRGRSMPYVAVSFYVFFLPYIRSAAQLEIVNYYRQVLTNSREKLKMFNIDE